MNSFDNETKAKNFLYYMKTKFFRFLLGLKKKTQDATKEKFSFVPDMEDYTKIWTDKELYEYFKLTEKEIKYIEEHID